MRKILVLVIVFVFILPSCSSGGSELKNNNQEGKFFNTGSQIGRYSENDTQTANDHMEQLMESLKNKDKKAIKSMFSKKALSEAENFDRQLNDLFEFFQGNVQKWDKCYPITSEDLEYGSVTKQLLWWSDVYTDKEQYIFVIIEYIKDTDHPDNVGLYTLRVNKSSSKFDDTETPGIFCPEN